MAWLFKFKGKSNNWWIGYRTNGKQVLKSTGTADEAEAKRQLEQVELLHQAHKSGTALEAIYQLLTQGSAPSLTLHGFAFRWLKDTRGSIEPVSHKKYERAVNGFLLFTKATEKGPKLTQVSAEQIRDYMRSLDGRLSTSSINVEKKILATMFRAAVADGHLKMSPMDNVRSLKLKPEERKTRRPFTPEEIRLVLKAAGQLKDKDAARFWVTLILLGLYSGQRLGDLLTLQVGNVNFQEGIIRLEQRKTGVRVEIPMHPDLSKALVTVISELRNPKPSDYIWNEAAESYIKSGAGKFSNAFGELLAAAGLSSRKVHAKTEGGVGRAGRRKSSEISFHSLRHSFVTFLKASGAPQAIAKQAAGHSSDVVSDHYTSLPAAALKGAINNLPSIS